MKNTVLLLLIFIGFSSCQFFETEKISSETFLEEEKKSINWKDVDSYPIFKECENITGKLEIKTCFESTLSNHLYISINSDKTIVSSDLNQEVFIFFLVNEKGELAITSVDMDSLLQVELPLLKNLIIRSIDSLQPIAPAYKRGIPVRTTFKLPMVIKSE